jgi:short-chain fatty acids transporter
MKSSKSPLSGKQIPSPFALAVLLTFLTFFLALILTGGEKSAGERVVAVLGYWQKGFWELLKFAMQMMLMLVLGSMIALTHPFSRLTGMILPLAKDNATAAFWVSLITILTAYINWGLALIFGALLAKKMWEYSQKAGFRLNYPLTGAAAYSGLMVWHGGFSGSAPLKVAESGHFLEARTGVIPITDTILSTSNILLFFAVIIIIPVVFYLMGRQKDFDSGFEVTATRAEENDMTRGKSAGLDGSRVFILITALFMSAAVIVSFVYGDITLNINTINLILFVAALFLYPDLRSFSSAASASVSSTTGIMLQFPLYAGIMGMMKYSGLTDVFTQFFIDISTTETFPLFTMISAGIVNFFVPSGGGQWAVQGPVIVEAAQNLGVPVSKAVMALAYGDQLTNMIQPFWALPLLAITGLKAGDILKYSFRIMIAGLLLFAVFLVL